MPWQMLLYGDDWSFRRNARMLQTLHNAVFQKWGRSHVDLFAKNMECETEHLLFKELSYRSSCYRLSFSCDGLDVNAFPLLRMIYKTCTKMAHLKFRVSPISPFWLKRIMFSWYLSPHIVPDLLNEAGWEQDPKQIKDLQLHYVLDKYCIGESLREVGFLPNVMVLATSLRSYLTIQLEIPKIPRLGSTEGHLLPQGPCDRDLPLPSDFVRQGQTGFYNLRNNWYALAGIHSASKMVQGSHKIL